MRNGAASLLCFLRPLFMEDLAFIATVRSSMPFSICCEADALGRRRSHDLPPWKTVYYYFRLWRKNGLWERLHTTLREQVRTKMGREARTLVQARPSAKVSKPS